MVVRLWPALGDAVGRKATLPDQVSASPNTTAEPVRPTASAFGPERLALQPVVVSATPVAPVDLAAYSPVASTAGEVASNAALATVADALGDADGIFHEVAASHAGIDTGTDTALTPIPLASIRFAFDSAVLSAAGRAQVAEAARVLGKADAGTPVTVTGFADTVGSDDYNLQLSQRRAGAVAAALSALGVPRDRMQVLGRGSGAAPVDGGSHDSEDGSGERMVWVELGAAPQSPVASRSDAPVTPFTDR
ncbi:OmpA family protein [Parahaliea mediterranea]|uniref:OmpA family protein n=1 Tax=Parahaliea mediterranea TaxID=651086 RepID=UPI000E2F8576|nr:OmpA family protein [Parahaliea mediterranea]